MRLFFLSVMKALAYTLQAFARTQNPRMKIFATVIKHPKIEKQRITKTAEGDGERVPGLH